MVRKKTTKLVVLFALVGAMMIVVPMLIEKVDAWTVGQAQSRFIGHDPPFTNVIGHLDAGKWVKFPTFNEGGWAHTWITKGKGVFGGNERGWITADFGAGRTLKFSWNNPNRGANTCSLDWTGKVWTTPSDPPFCKIITTNHVYIEAEVKYVVSTSNVIRH